MASRFQTICDDVRFVPDLTAQSGSSIPRPMLAEQKPGRFSSGLPCPFYLLFHVGSRCVGGSQSGRRTSASIAEHNALGVQASVYNVIAKTWIYTCDARESTTNSNPGTPTVGCGEDREVAPASTRAQDASFPKRSLRAVSAACSIWLEA
jgi:hypothetical protein